MNIDKDCIELTIKRAHVLRTKTIRRAAVRMWDTLVSLWRGCRSTNEEELL